MNTKEAAKMLADNMGCSEEDALNEMFLDGIVHDAKGEEAAAINNSGVAEQLSYILGVEVVDITKWDVEVAVLHSQPQSYDLMTVVVEAEDEDAAFLAAEDVVNEMIIEEYGSDHNVAGIHHWNCTEREEEEYESEVENPTDDLPPEG
jgi:hypothetical protein